MTNQIDVMPIQLIFVNYRTIEFFKLSKFGKMTKNPKLAESDKITEIFENAQYITLVVMIFLYH